MNPRIKQLWIDALRSGEYPQARGALKTVSGYCCLGVLCDLAAKEGLGSFENEPGTYASGDAGEVEGEAAFYFRTPNGDFVEGDLNASLATWAGLTALDKYTYDINELKINHIHLAQLNDGSKDDSVRPHTFLEIADLIEKHL